MGSKFSLAILIVGGLAVLVLLGSAVSAPQDDAIADIRSDHRSDNTAASGAPQQQVVNGWTTHAYLELVLEQQARQERMLGVGFAALVAMAGLAFVGSQRAAESRSQQIQFRGPANSPPGWPPSGPRGPTAPPAAPSGGTPPG